MNSDNSLSRAQLVRAVVGFILYLLLSPLILFGAAGTMAWPAGWVYVALTWLSIMGSRLVVWRRDPALLRERARFTESEGVAPRDRLLMLTVGLLAPALIALIAGLDYRFGWSTVGAAAVQAAAALVVAGGYGLAVWAMIANAYFSAVARVQADRGQVVISSGPYRWVRHPAYAGGLAAAVAIPLLLDSLCALGPGVLLLGALVWRTRLEDALLQAELPGYRDYAGRVRYRLLPFIW